MARSGRRDDRVGGGGGFVWSTQHGRLCATCNRPVDACVCKRTDVGGAPRDGVVRVARQTQGRKGKGVTVITGVPLRGAELARLAKELKQACGSGGTVKDGVVEIQGDHRDRVVEALQGRGWTVKRAGG